MSWNSENDLFDSDLGVNDISSETEGEKKLRLAREAEEKAAWLKEKEEWDNDARSFEAKVASKRLFLATLSQEEILALWAKIGEVSDGEIAIWDNCSECTYTHRFSADLLSAEEIDLASELCQIE